MNDTNQTNDSNQKRLIPKLSAIMYDPRDTVGWFLLRNQNYVIKNKSNILLLSLSWVISGIISFCAVYEIIPQYFVLIGFITIIQAIHTYLLLNRIILLRLLLSFETIFRLGYLIIFLICISFMTSNPYILIYYYIAIFSLNLINFTDALPEKVRKQLTIFAYPFGILSCIIFLFTFYKNWIIFDNEKVYFVGGFTYNLKSIASSAIINILIMFIKSTIIILQDSKQLVTISTHMISFSIPKQFSRLPTRDRNKQKIVPS